MSENTLPNLYESGKNSNLEMEYSGELEKDFKDYNTTDSCSSDEDLKEKNPEFDQRVKSPLRLKLESWLNKNMKIEMTDGRTLIGIFLCTDRDRNIILGSCSEYLKPDEEGSIEEPRLLGLAMVPGGHIVSINIDQKQMPWMQRSSNVN